MVDGTGDREPSVPVKGEIKQKLLEAENLKLELFGS
jgi:hypothetical protein